jgi:hypothetical protein
LGLTQGQQVTGNELQNIGSYVTENPQQATAQNVASQQQYNQLAALQQLGGNAAPQQAQNILQQYAGQSGQAGQYNANAAVQGNATGFQNANTAQINAYNQQIDPSQTALNNSNQILNLAQQEQALATNPFSAGSSQLTGLENQVRAISPEAAGGPGGTTGLGWAQGSQATAQQQYNAALAAANAATGGLRTFNITPQQAALQQIQQGNS